jgi:hypothetical protein
MAEDFSVLDVAGVADAGTTSDLAAGMGSGDATGVTEAPSTDTTTTDSAVAERNDVREKIGLEPLSPEQAAEERAEQGGAPAEEFKGTPQQVRAALKAFRDANPNNVAATKLLHGHYERWEAAKQIFPIIMALMR